jgi:hypothetical protein
MEPLITGENLEGRAGRTGRPSRTRCGPEPVRSSSRVAQGRRSMDSVIAYIRRSNQGLDAWVSLSLVSVAVLYPHWRRSYCCQPRAAPWS